MILILGASGRLGSHIFKKLKQDNLDVLGTHCNKAHENTFHFDLENMTLSELNLPIKPSHAIIAAAANPRPELSKDAQGYATNVTGTKKLIKECFSKGIIPVYFSSDNVFDGEKGDYKEADRTNPLNNYGKMKCEIEDYLLSSHNPYILARMGKVFGIEGDDTLLEETLKKMKNDAKILCSTDQVFTPCYADDLYDFLKHLVTDNSAGIFHIASAYSLTRYDVAKKIRDYFHIEAKIIPCKINEIGLSEKRPLKIDLNTEKYEKMTGRSKKPIESFFDLLRI